MRVLGVIGKVLIGAGVLLLLFAAYQVWGTTFQEEHTQSSLRATLVHQAHDAQLRQALEQAAALNKLPTGPPVAAAGTSAPAEGDAVGVIRVPRIGLNQVLVEGTNNPDLRKGPGHYTGTPLPGQVGNVGIAGHRTTYGHPFYSLDAVKVGDPIVLTTVQGIFVYDAVHTQVVSPNDTAVLKNTTGDFVTLTTCNPRFSASTRLVVTAQLAHSQLFPNSGLPKSHAQKVQSGDLAGNSTGDLTNALFWGFIWLVLGGVVLALGLRYHRQRWPIFGVGTVALLGVLYVFFTAVTPLLPASF